jgi:hypothetical protein
MAGDSGTHRLGSGLPQTRRAFPVGQHERHRADRRWKVACSMPSARPLGGNCLIARASVRTACSRLFGSPRHPETR